MSQPSVSSQQETIDALHDENGYAFVAWFSFPSLTGIWKPSKVHLSTVTCGPALCGARLPRGAQWSVSPSSFTEHREDAGADCQRCRAAAAKRGPLTPTR